MKNLFENWRKYLTETIDPRIQKQIDMLLTVPDVAVMVTGEYSFGQAFRYVLVTEVEGKKQYKDLVSSTDGVIDGRQLPWGMGEIMTPDGEDDGDCLGGWVVISSEAQRGWGPLLYDIALEWASQNGGGLTADRISVSKYATAVWDKYSQRGDVSKSQLDIYKGTRVPDDLKDKIKQITPDEEGDDCNQRNPIRRDGENWKDNSLSKMYKKEKPEVMQALKAAGRLIVV